MKKNDFINMLRPYENIIIYGAKNIATATAVYLHALELSAQVKFAVTHKIWNPDQILGHKVYEIDELQPIAEKSYVLISVRKYQDEIKTILEENGFSHYMVMDLTLFRDSTLNYAKVLGENQCEMVNKLLHEPNVTDVQMATYMGKCDRQLALEMQIVSHCNLNCKSCCVFSPLATEEYMSLEQYEKDIARIYELVDEKKLERFTLVGGEPLLHPNINDFIVLFRKYFKHTELCVFTNLIVLNSKPLDDFLDCCAKNDVNIVYTRYPINVNYDMIEKRLNRKGIKYIVFNGVKEEKKFDMMMHDLDGKYDKQVNFAKCFGNNPQIKNGILYPCSIAPSFSRFSTYFNKNIYPSDQDGVNIYEVKSYNELLDQLNRPMEICRYCGYSDVIGGQKWAVSNKKIEEWIRNYD